MARQIVTIEDGTRFNLKDEASAAEFAFRAARLGHSCRIRKDVDNKDAARIFRLALSSSMRSAKGKGPK